MVHASATGGWHLSRTFQYKLDNGLVRALVPHVQNKAVLDIGAGMGRYVLALGSYGVQVEGLDGADNIEERRLTPRVRHADLSRSLTPCVPHDWVLFLEIGEHIARQFETAVFRNINCSTRETAVISWAHPGQFGHGHVNCRSQLHVIERMAEYGFRPSAAIAAELKRNSTLPWFRSNLLVFDRRPVWTATPALQQTS